MIIGFKIRRMVRNAEFLIEHRNLRGMSRADHDHRSRVRSHDVDQIGALLFKKLEALAVVTRGHASHDPLRLSPNELP